jgi:hypothetical protein
MAKVKMSHIRNLILSDEERHPLIIESKDWERISPALQEIGQALVSHIDAPIAAYAITSTLRILFETVYVIGYKRGHKETSFPQFVVAEEEIDG